MRRLQVFGTVLILLALAFLGVSGRFLVVNQPQKADAIVVLAGETDRRPARGLELLDQDYSSRLILDVPAQARIYTSSQLDMAQKYVQALPQASAITICPINGLSTRDEAMDVRRCLNGSRVSSILLITSDYHTRRALSIFRQVMPEYQYSVAAAFDSREFGSRWWQHREWAKINLDEWLRFLWWELVDRWRSEFARLG